MNVTYQDEKELAVWGTYPPMPQTVRLLDGTTVTVRLIRPDDAPRLQAFFARLSQDSIYLRFLQHRKELSYQQATRLATVDYQTQMALVAIHKGNIIAIARYVVILFDEPNWAEPAIVVEDEYQGRGLGVLLLKWLLEHARSRGIQAFQGTVHPSNTQMLRFIGRSQLPINKRFESGTWNITIQLEPNSPLNPLT